MSSCKRRHRSSMVEFLECASREGSSTPPTHPPSSSPLLSTIFLCAFGSELPRSVSCSFFFFSFCAEVVALYRRFASCLIFLCQCSCVCAHAFSDRVDLVRLFRRCTPRFIFYFLAHWAGQSVWWVVCLLLSFIELEPCFFV